MNLRQYVVALRRHRLTFAIVTLLIAALGLTFVLVQPMPYLSSTRLLVTIDGDSTASAYKNDDAVAARINTYIPLLSSSAVTRPVRDKLGLQFSDAQMAERISATRVPPRTALIDVEATGDTAEQAQALAQAVADQFVVYTAAVETATGEDTQKIRTRVVDPAGDGRADILRPLLMASVILVGAVLVGLIAVWTRARRRSPE